MTGSVATHWYEGLWLGEDPSKDLFDIVYLKMTFSNHQGTATEEIAFGAEDYSANPNVDVQPGRFPTFIFDKNDLNLPAGFQ